MEWRYSSSILTAAVPTCNGCNHPALFINCVTELTREGDTGKITNVNFLLKFTGKFQQYDNGCSRDQKGFKDEQCGAAADAQEYDLSKITVPLDLHYADNDWLASPVVRMKKG